MRHSGADALREGSACLSPQRCRSGGRPLTAGPSALPHGGRGGRDFSAPRAAPSNAQRSLLPCTLTRTAPLPSVRHCDKPQWRCAAEHVPEWIQFEKEATNGISSTEGLSDLCHSDASRRSGLVQPRGEVCGKGAVVSLSRCCRDTAVWSRIHLW